MSEHAQLDWLEQLGRLRADGTPCAMVVVTDTKGSAPRDAGARMLVADGRLAWGTIGGGNLEKLALEHAAELLAGGATVSETRTYPLADAAGQCCGGQVTLFFETYRWSRPTIAIFGAGHVGQALAGLAPWLEARVLLIDGRAEDELVPAGPAAGARPYELVCVDAPEAELATLPADALVVVMTHSHALDLTLIEEALRAHAFPYLGLIGSARKWKRFRARLLARGLPAERVDAVRCPIGSSAGAGGSGPREADEPRGSKAPNAIALDVANELRARLEARVS